MLESSFSLRAYLSVVATLVFIVLLIVCIINFEDAFSGPGGGIMVCSISAFSALSFFQDSRKNTPVISIKRHEKNAEDNEITVSKCFGLGKDENYIIKQLDGFRTLSVTSKGTVYNYILLIKNGRRITKICDKYYSNYEEISGFLKNNLTELGHTNGNSFSEIIDLFKK